MATQRTPNSHSSLLRCDLPTSTLTEASESDVLKTEASEHRRTETSIEYRPAEESLPGFSKIDAAVAEIITSLERNSPQALGEEARRVMAERCDDQSAADILARRVDLLRNMVDGLIFTHFEAEDKLAKQLDINKDLRQELDEQRARNAKLAEEKKLMQGSALLTSQIYKKVASLEVENADLIRQLSVLAVSHSTADISAEQAKMKATQQEMTITAHEDEVKMLKFTIAQLEQDKQEFSKSFDALSASSDARNQEIDTLRRDLQQESAKSLKSEAAVKELSRKCEVLQHENQLFAKQLETADRLRQELEYKIKGRAMSREGSVLDSNATVRYLEERSQTLMGRVSTLEKETTDLYTQVEELKFTSERSAEALEVMAKDRDSLALKNAKILQDNSELVRFKMFSVSNAAREKNHLEGIIRCYSVLAGKKQASIETLESRFVSQIEELKHKLNILEGEIEALKTKLAEKQEDLEQSQASAQALSAERYKQLEVNKDLGVKLTFSENKKQKLEQELESAHRELNAYRESLQTTSKANSELDSVVAALRDEIQELVGERARLQSALADEQMCRQQMKEMLQDLTVLEDENLTLKQKAEENKQEIDSLKAELQKKEAEPPQPKETAPSHVFEFLQRLAEKQKEMLAQAEERSAKSEAMIKQLISDQEATTTQSALRIRKLEEDLAEMKKTVLKHTLAKFALAFNQQRREDRIVVFHKWLFETAVPHTPLPDSIFDLIPKTLSFAEETWDAETLEKFVAVHDFLDEEWRSEMRDTLMTLQCQQRPTVFSTPSAVESCAAFWNQVINEKRAEDELALSSQKKPQTFAEYLIACVKDRHSLSRDKMTHHVLGLYEAFQTQQDFALLVSKLLQVLDPSPAALEAQLVVANYAGQFTDCFGEMRLEDTVPLSAVLDQYYDVAKQQEHVVHHWISHLKPKDMTARDFVLYAVYWKLARNRQTPEEFWRYTKPKPVTQMSEEQLEAALIHLDLYFSYGIISETAPLSRQYYRSKSNILETDCHVSKAQFLLGVLEACQAKVRRAALSAHTLFLSLNQTEVDRHQFLELLSESQLSPDTLANLYQEGLKMSSSPTGIDHGAFVRLLSRRMVGVDGQQPFAEPLHRELFDDTDSQFL